MIEETKMSKQTLLAPTARVVGPAVGPCPTLIQLSSSNLRMIHWFVGCLYRTVSQKREKEKRKNVKTISPAPTASAVGPCPTLIQIGLK